MMDPCHAMSIALYLTMSSIFVCLGNTILILSLKSARRQTKRRKRIYDNFWIPSGRRYDGINLVILIFPSSRKILEKWEPNHSHLHQVGMNLLNYKLKIAMEDSALEWISSLIEEKTPVKQKFKRHKGKCIEVVREKLRKSSTKVLFNPDLP